MSCSSDDKDGPSVPGLLGVISTARVSWHKGRRGKLALWGSHGLCGMNKISTRFLHPRNTAHIEPGGSRVHNRVVLLSQSSGLEARISDRAASGEDSTQGRESSLWE